jgi:hypothetical protein
VMLGSRFRAMLICLVSTLTTACYEVKIDSLAKWCEHTSSIDLTEKYAPAWAISRAFLSTMTTSGQTSSKYSILCRSSLSPLQLRHGLSR